MYILIETIFLHVLAMAIFGLGVLFVFRILRAEKAPSSTIAWLLVIFLIPYIGVPLYIVFGGRKIKGKIKKKEVLDKIVTELLSPDEISNRFLPGGISGLFPKRSKNSVSILATGGKAFHEIEKHIKSAQESIYITTFILGNDATGRSILEMLARKAKQGIKVCLLMDALGSFRVSGRFLAEFKQAGGRYAFFMPMFHWPFSGRANLRNHRKMVIVDNKIAMVGGMNLAKEYMGDTADLARWHDLSVLVAGPIVADIYTVFRADWKFAAKETLPVVKQKDADADAGRDVGIQLVPSGPDVKEDPLYDTVLASIFNARKRIWVVTPYFIPDEMLTKALCIAAKRNLDVRIIMPLVSNHRIADFARRSYLRQIQHAGGKIYSFKPGMLHGKLILADDTLGIIGSMNMDARSFFLNYEAAMFVYSEPVVKQLESWITGIMSECKTGVKEASPFGGIIEGIVRLFAPLL
jgi:cardiolipin synthase